MPAKTCLRPLLLIALTSLAACTGMQGPNVDTHGPAVTASSGATVAPATPEAPPAAPDTTTTAPPAPPANPAVVALLDNAHANANAGRLPSATAAVERALRIEPRNPLLWQELALLKLKKGDYPQAESFAARSNSWAGANKALLAKNWRIISEARSLRGDNEGARAALARAKSLEQ